MRTLAMFLAQLEVTPQDTPEEFDRLQRELCAWWQQGGSCRAFIERHKAARAPAAQLRRAWRPGYPSPLAG